MTSEARWLYALGVVGALACADVKSPSPTRTAPLLVDDDQRPFSVDCRLEGRGDKARRVCAPEVYVSPLAWDAADNSIFYPLTRGFALNPAGEATNVNSLDEVPDSSWFQNRPLSFWRDLKDFSQGACNEDQLLHPEDDAPRSWIIDKGKQDGSTPGFRIQVRGKKYMMKIDSNDKTPSGAVIGAVLSHAAGYNTSCEQLLYIDPALLELTPGLTITDNSGVTRPFDRAALDKVLALGTRRGKGIRVQASAWLSGYSLGPFSYLGTRPDDYNDVVPHEDRRELRGARVLSSWIEHIDAREQNSMDTWVAQNPDDETASPGYVKHYIMDFSDALGATWVWDDISRRLGHSYLLDGPDIAQDIVTFGIPLRRWDTTKMEPGHEMFTYFRADDFDPDGWKNEYPNPAYSRASERDNAWMTRILARLSAAHVHTLVEIGAFDAEQSAYLEMILQGRLRRIFERYLTRLSPLGDLRLEGKALCAVDWARARGLRADAQFHYRVESAGRALPVTVGDNGKTCVTLPEPRPSSLVLLEWTNGVASAPLRVRLESHRSGYRLLAIERPSPH
jgi:hypothetical protein